MPAQIPSSASLAENRFEDYFSLKFYIINQNILLILCSPQWQDCLDANIEGKITGWHLKLPSNRSRGTPRRLGQQRLLNNV